MVISTSSFMAVLLGVVVFGIAWQRRLLFVPKLQAALGAHSTARLHNFGLEQTV